MEAAETLCMVFILPEEHTFRRKYRGNRPFKKSHFIGFDNKICIFKDLLNTVKCIFLKIHY